MAPQGPLLARMKCSSMEDVLPLASLPASALSLEATHAERPVEAARGGPANVSPELLLRKPMRR